MSSQEYFRLALLQQVRYRQQLEECLRVEEEIAGLRAEIATHHKKHRRCDRQMAKNYQCGLCERTYASDIARKLHLKLKHRPSLEEKEYSTEDSRWQGEKESEESRVVVESNLA